MWAEKQTFYSTEHHERTERPTSDIAFVFSVRLGSKTRQDRSRVIFTHSTGSEKNTAKQNTQIERQK